MCGPLIVDRMIIWSIKGMGIRGALRALASGHVEVGQLGGVVEGHTDSGVPDIGVGIVDVAIEVGDGTEHETLELALGDVDGSVVEEAKLVDEGGVFHPAFQGAEADARAAGSLGEGGGGDDGGQDRVLTQGKRRGVIGRCVLVHWSPLSCGG